MTNVFYHISTDLAMGQSLEPRRPRFIMNQLENGDIERICVSTSIEGCLTSIRGGDSLAETLMATRNCVKLLKIDTQKIGYNPSFIVDSDTLYREEFVWDADITKEHWLMNPVTIPDEDVSIISILGYDIVAQDMYTYEFEKDYLNNPANEDEDIEDLWAEYAEKKELDNTNVKSKVVIENVRYQTSKMKAGDTFLMNLDKDENIIEEHLLDIFGNIPVEVSYLWGELSITAKEDIDITNAVLKITEMLDGILI